MQKHLLPSRQSPKGFLLTLEKEALSNHIYYTGIKSSEFSNCALKNEGKLSSSVQFENDVKPMQQYEQITTSDLLSVLEHTQN